MSSGRVEVRIESGPGPLRIEGSSRAGDSNWLKIHPPGLAFDVGRGSLQLGGSRDLFVSHGHLDHALGLPFAISQRTLHESVSTRVFCPAEIAEDLRAFVVAAERLERVSYRWELFPLEVGDRVEVARDLSVEAFAVDHVVPSLGFHLLRTKRRLAAGFQGKEPAELAALRSSGVAIEETIEELWVSYCADTGPGVFELEPRVFASPVLILECTFLSPELRDRAARYKHMHIDEIVARADRFQNQAIVLQHLSHRHTFADLEQAVEERLPTLAARIQILRAL
ncbi:MAG TPA: MBL fold metallo-hydrolase [Thermoanaerobaculia bacterium]|jgi:ribonuclease Z|nr:MBL fold metallo-hydrolase [Thermoanaerobaculia bacterium]